LKKFVLISKDKNLLNIQNFLNFVFEMEKTKTIRFKKAMMALLLVSAAHIAFASFTGTSENKSRNLYSLKNFNRTFYRSASPFSLRAGFEYKGSQLLSVKKEDNGSLSMNSVLRYEKGNTVYIYPYKVKVSVPKFKTPTPPAFR
jgi:hypothetical protein